MKNQLKDDVFSNIHFQIAWIYHNILPLSKILKYVDISLGHCFQWYRIISQEYDCQINSCFNSWDMSAARCDSMVIECLKQERVDANNKQQLNIYSHPSLLNNIHWLFTVCYWSTHSCMLTISCKFQTLFFSFHYFESHWGLQDCSKNLSAFILLGIPTIPNIAFKLFP